MSDPAYTITSIATPAAPTWRILGLDLSCDEVLVFALLRVTHDGAEFDTVFPITATEMTLGIEPGDLLTDSSDGVVWVGSASSALDAYDQWSSEQSEVEGRRLDLLAARATR